MTKQIDVDNLRKAMGTLPDRTETKSYEYLNAFKSCYVNLLDYPNNSFKNIVSMATSTWGSAGVGKSEGSCGKWEKISPENRYRIVLAALTGKTLPLCLESVSFLFEFNGIPRHTFDQFARLRIGGGVSSAGCRDNSKLDAPLILYPNLYDFIVSDSFIKARFERWLRDTKDLYGIILKSKAGSYQMARAVLPMSYNHSWTSYMNFLTLKTQAARRMMACEEAPMTLIFWRIREEIKNKVSPLLANYLRPLCDSAKRCVYAGGIEDLSRLFSCLFKGCGRWTAEHGYAEFNLSCSDYQSLSHYVEIVSKDGWTEYGLDDYNKLSDLDRKYFEAK
jgi:hypothetical protein